MKARSLTVTLWILGNVISSAQLSTFDCSPGRTREQYAYHVAPCTRSLSFSVGTIPSTPPLMKSDTWIRVWELNASESSPERRRMRRMAINTTWFPIDSIVTIELVEPVRARTSDGIRVSYEIETDCSYWFDTDVGSNSFTIDVADVTRYRFEVRDLLTGSALPAEIVGSSDSAVYHVEYGEFIQLNATRAYQQYEFDSWSVNDTRIQVRMGDPIQDVSTECWPYPDTMVFTAWYATAATDVDDSSTGEAWDVRHCIIYDYNGQQCSLPLSTGWYLVRKGNLSRPLFIMK